MDVIGWASTNFNKMAKQTAIDFLAEKYNYITWMRNRDEISAGTADKWRSEFLKQAKEMEKKQIVDAYLAGTIQFDNAAPIVRPKTADTYYDETFGDVF